MGLADRLKTLSGSINLVIANSDRRELVDAIRSRCGGEGGAGAFVGERDLGAADYGTGSVLDGAGNAAGVHLCMEESRA